MKHQYLAKVWGFEGCGAMWTFFSKREQALKAAGKNQIYDFTLAEASELDNQRRQELGFVRITLRQFLDCIDGASCVPDRQGCQAKGT